MDSFLILIYGAAFAAILYYVINLKPAQPSANVDSTELQGSAWSWPITSYSYWSEWMSSHDFLHPESEGYGYEGHGRIPGHSGGYGYTGRQSATYDCSFEGDGQGYDMLGGSYGGGGGYGYTGREKVENHCHKHTHKKPADFS